RELKGSDLGPNREAAGDDLKTLQPLNVWPVHPIRYVFCASAASLRSLRRLTVVQILTYLRSGHGLRVLCQRQRIFMRVRPLALSKSPKWCRANVRSAFGLRTTKLP